MNEFELIDRFFKSIPSQRNDVVFGIGDDAACLTVPKDMQLIVTTDTLVADCHFLSSWDAFDIAYKAVMVNVSDIAAMGAEPSWLSLSLTLPESDEVWLSRFSKGLNEAMQPYNIALIGGDTTKGPLSITITLHGLVPASKAVRRDGAKPGDKIYVTGLLGASALAVDFLEKKNVNALHKETVMDRLLRPTPRVDMGKVLRRFASAAIDISDGLSADLNHICESSQVGACLNLKNIPVHPMVLAYQGEEAIEFALQGGDDYELCYTVSPMLEHEMLQMLLLEGLNAHLIGNIEAQPGLRGQKNGLVKPLTIKGYRHF
ncbi:thiamine-phosphate kinase [Legionella impletisoli]|uniref:Thiamine-monophosphate kinase n=1 Tax=Legionella impletisoli TaxID=343510 RepID=A0A917NFH2_9GAMM|nr:thiamine-phosphate kinase [Legionella impletisoli]GGI92867.1 thiamine-monophosphate kinase [Legionella impletisoli]